MLRILPPSCLIKANCFSLCFYMGSNLMHFIILFKGFRKLVDVTAPRLPGWQFLFFDGSSPKRMLNLASVQVRKSLLIGRHDRISVGKMDLLSDQTLRRAPLSFQLLAARLNNCIHLKNRPWVLLKGSDSAEELWEGELQSADLDDAWLFQLYVVVAELILCVRWVNNLICGMCVRVWACLCIRACALLN